MGMWQFESSHDSHPVRVLENFFLECKKSPPMAGFSCTLCLYRDRIRTTIFRNRGPVSTQPLKNSRFPETRLRDRRIKPLRDDPAVCLGRLRRKGEQHERARNAFDKRQLVLSICSHGTGTVVLLRISMGVAALNARGCWRPARDFSIDFDRANGMPDIVADFPCWTFWQEFCWATCAAARALQLLQ